MDITQMRRDYSLDWLKTIGTLCLFLAHVEAPFWIKEIRGFDVPLMVFLSGLLATGSLSRVSSNGAYIWKRIKRLIIPTWIFLVFFYICMTIAGQLPDLGTIVKSFLFQRDGGIAGYTWIIWVYILCSILTPFLVKTSKSKYSWIVFLVLTCGYELLCSFTSLSQARILYYTVFTAIPYGLFLFLAISYERFTRKQKATIAIGFLVFHTIYAIVLNAKYGHYVSLGDYKYPARLYYFSYAIPVIIGLLGLFRRKLFMKKPAAIVDFISRHSLWIYLWHIMVLAVLNYVLKIQNWVICYVLLVFLSISITYLQLCLVRILQKKHSYGWLSYFMG